MKTNLSHGEISGLCLELSLLLHVGVGLGDGLALLGEESDGPSRELPETIARQVDEGATLSAAMKETERFPAYVCGLIEVGEAALENAMSQVEPALVLICSLLVGLILLSVMLPLMHIMSAIG